MKTTSYFIYDKNNIKIGTHLYSKGYEDKIYLLAQWAIDTKSINDLSISLIEGTLKRKIQKKI